MQLRPFSPFGPESQHSCDCSRHHNSNAPQHLEQLRHAGRRVLAAVGCRTATRAAHALDDCSISRSCFAARRGAPIAGQQHARLVEAEPAGFTARALVVGRRRQESQQLRTRPCRSTHSPCPGPPLLNVLSHSLLLIARFEAAAAAPSALAPTSGVGKSPPSVMDHSAQSARPHFCTQSTNRPRCDRRGAGGRSGGRRPHSCPTITVHGRDSDRGAAHPGPGA